MRILILKNIEREGPGLITDWFELKDIEYDILEVSTDLFYQDFFDRYDGLIVLGGPSSANDKTVVIQRELAFVEKWLKHGKPYLGVCLGMQLMMKSQGGRVYPNQVNEIGFYHLEEQEQPYLIELESETLSDVLRSQFPVFQLHGETVSHETIPSLAKSKWCNYQICKVGDKQIGVQFHIEVTLEMLKMWLDQDEDLLSLDGTEILKAYKTHKEALETNCFSLLKHVFE